MSIIQGTSKVAGGGYIIDQSCRFNDNDSAFTAWTPGGVGDSSKIFTIDMWVKRANLGISTDIFTAGLPANDSNYCHISFDTSDRIIVKNRVAVAFPIDFATTAVYRDPSAWMHIHLACDTTQASATDGFKLTVNGVRVTSFALSTYTQNSEFWFSKANLHRVGRASNNYSLPYYDGYLSEMRYIDGIQKEPTDFGKTNADGVWVPIEYTGAYGTNGFYLDFANSSDFGSDQSGNGNDFTDSGLTTTDQMLDTPTVNYCTLNPLDDITTGQILSDGNLTAQWVYPNQRTFMGTMAPSSGKFYWEFVMTAGGVAQYVGVMPIDRATRNTVYTVSGSAGHNGVGNQAVVYNFYNGNKLINGAETAYGASVASGVVVGVALNLDDQEVTFYKANVSQGVIALPVSGKDWAPAFSHGGDYSTNTVNFGATAFTYTPPTGFLELNTANLPEPTIKDGSAYFQTTLYTGNGTAIGSGGNAISQSGNSTFQPDFVWIKGRSGATEHVLTDAVRGVTKELSSNDAGAEETVAEGLTTFGSAGFTVGSDGSYNTSSATYAAWQWKANGTGSSNTDGSITSTVSANPTAGFSIVTYTGTGANATVGHGLGVAPKMVIVKERSPGPDDWYVYHMGLTSASYSLHLNTNAAQSGPSAAYWNSTAPTSSVFSLGTSVGVNQNTATYVAYCFADVEGFSKMGVYTGNGSANGPMVNCGFRPAFVMFKRSDSTGSWFIEDSARGTYNVMGPELYANSADAEATSSRLDFLSNGFKLRAGNAGDNASGGTYIYMAFAENPFGGANTAPATAR